MRLAPLLMLLALAQAPQKGTIEVNVRDSATGMPIPGADLTVIFYQTPPPNVVTRSTADDNGRAVLTDLASGRYSIRAERDGYINTPLLPGINAVLDAQNMKRTLDLTLTRGAAINGQVLDSKGLPVAQASVQLLRKTYRDGRAILARQIDSRAETNDRGQYRLIGIAPGDYFLQTEVHPTRTAGQDKYVRTSYYPNSVDTARATPMRISGSAELAGVDIRIPDIASFTISGKVINATTGGRALPNGQVARAVASFFIGPRDTTSMEEPILVPNRLYSQAANSDETPFELTGFAPGSYYLYPISDGTLSFTTKRTAIDVSDKNIEGLTITLQTPGDVKGRIFVEGDASTIRLDQIRVTPRWKEALPTLVSIRTTPTVANPSGEFTLTAFPESRFTPLLNGLPPDAYVSEIRQGAGSVYSDGTVTIGPGESDVIQITVNPKGATIQGAVLKADQQPFPNAGVVLVPAITRRGNSLLYKRVTADASGHFTMRGVAPGTYKLFAWPSLPEGSAEENAEFIAPFEGRGTVVNLEIGGVATTEVKVIQ